MKPLIIGIAGGSGSGKTTLARALHEALPERSQILYQDSYYIDQSHRFDGDGGAVNFDHPESLEFSLLAKHLQCLKRGESVEVPEYDFATHTRRAETHSFKCSPVIIVDGILLLSQPGVVAALDLKVFVKTEESLRFSRRLERDVRERGRTAEGVRRQFERQVKPMHDLFVEPSQLHADMSFSGAVATEICVKTLLDWIQGQNARS